MLTDDFIYVENEQHEAISTPVTTSFAGEFIRTGMGASTTDR